MYDWDGMGTQHNVPYSWIDITTLRSYELAEVIPILLASSTEISPSIFRSN